MNCHPTLCGMLVEVEDGRLIGVKGDPENPDSRGFLCVRGHASREIIGNPRRLLFPLVRDRRTDDTWRRVSWDEALDDIAGRIRQAILEDRRDEIMYHIGRPGENAFTSGRCRPGGSTATTPTRTCARPGRGSGRRCGRGMTGRAPITPMPG